MRYESNYETSEARIDHRIDGDDFPELESRDIADFEDIVGVPSARSGEQSSW